MVLEVPYSQKRKEAMRKNRRAIDLLNRSKDQILYGLMGRQALQLIVIRMRTITIIITTITIYLHHCHRHQRHHHQLDIIDLITRFFAREHDQRVIDPRKVYLRQLSKLRTLEAYRLALVVATQHEL